MFIYGRFYFTTYESVQLKWKISFLTTKKQSLAKQKFMSLGTSCNSSLIITDLLKIFSCLFLLRMFTDNIIEIVEEKAFGFGNVNESPEGGMKV